MAKVLAGEQAQWEPIAIDLQRLELGLVILSTINERELLILSGSSASPLFYYDIIADTWRSAANVLKWEEDLQDEVIEN